MSRNVRLAYDDGVERVMMVFICKMIFIATRMPKLLPIVPILMIAFSFFEVKDVTMLFGDGKASERIAMIRKRLVKGIV